jgi:hypothetical protein
MKIDSNGAVPSIRPGLRYALTFLFVVGGCTTSDRNGATSNAAGEADVAVSCRLDPTVACTSPALGYSCAATSAPFAALTCSPPSPGNDAGTSVYCCFPPTTCRTDRTVTRCPAGSSGYLCTGTDTPAEDDPRLSCAAGTAADSGTTAYCCSGNDGGMATGDADVRAADVEAADAEIDATDAPDGGTDIDANEVNDGDDGDLGADGD